MVALVLPSDIRNLRRLLLVISLVHLIAALQTLPRASYSSFHTYQLAGFLSDLPMAYAAGSSIQGAE